METNANTNNFAPAAGYVPQTKVQLPNSTKSPAVLILAVNPVEFLGFYPPYPLFWKCCETRGVKPQNPPLSAKMLRNKGLGGVKPKEIENLTVCQSDGSRNLKINYGRYIQRYTRILGLMLFFWFLQAITKIRISEDIEVVDPPPPFSN